MWVAKEAARCPRATGPAAPAHRWSAATPRWRCSRPRCRLSIRNQRSQLVLLLGEAGVGKTPPGAARSRRSCADQWPDARRAQRSLRPLRRGEPVVADRRGAARRRAASTLDERRSIGRRSSRVGRRSSTCSSRDDRRGSTRSPTGCSTCMGYDGPLRGLDPARAAGRGDPALLAYLEASVARRGRSWSASPTSTGPTSSCSSSIDELVRAAGPVAPFVLLATARRALLRAVVAARRPAQHARAQPRPARPVVVRARSSTRSPASSSRPTCATMLLDRTGGNPLYLEELVTARAADGAMASTTLRRRRSSCPTRCAAWSRPARRARPPTSSSRSRTPRCGAPRVRSRRSSAWPRQTRAGTDVARWSASLDDQGDPRPSTATTWSFRSDLIREVAYARLTKLDRSGATTASPPTSRHGVAGRLRRRLATSIPSPRHYTEAAAPRRRDGPGRPRVARRPDRARRCTGWTRPLAGPSDRASLAARRSVATTRRSSSPAPPTVDYGSAELVVLGRGRARARCELWRLRRRARRRRARRGAGRARRRRDVPRARHGRPGRSAEVARGQRREASDGCLDRRGRRSRPTSATSQGRAEARRLRGHGVAVPAATIDRRRGADRRARSTTSARSAIAEARPGRCRTWRGSPSRRVGSTRPRPDSRRRPSAFDELGDLRRPGLGRTA